MNCAATLLVLGLGGGLVPDLSGMTDLAFELKKYPRVHVRLFTHDADAEMVSFAKRHAWKCHIVLVGHSAGGSAIVRVAHRLLPEAIPVKLLIAIDPADRAVLPLLPLPANVEAADSYRQNGFLGGGSIRRAAGNQLTAYMRNTTVDYAHITMPKHYVGKIIADIRRLSGARGRMPK